MIKAEKPCTTIADANDNGVIDADRKKDFILCIKGANGGYNGDADKQVSPKELRCGHQADTNLKPKKLNSAKSKAKPRLSRAI